MDLGASGAGGRREHDRHCRELSIGQGRTAGVRPPSTSVQSPQLFTSSSIGSPNPGVTGGTEGPTRGNIAPGYDSDVGQGGQTWPTVRYRSPCPTWLSHLRQSWLRLSEQP